MKATVGWADLARAYDNAGDVALEAYAEALGFTRRVELPVATIDVTRVEVGEVAGVETDPVRPPYWLAESFEMLERVPPPPDRPRRERRVATKTPGPLPVTPSLMPRSVLAGHLKRARSSPANGGLDVDHLVRDLARGRVPTHLPRLPTRVNRGRLWVLVDGSRHLVPFRSDVVEALELLSSDGGDDLRWSLLRWGPHPHPPPGADDLSLRSPWGAAPDDLIVLLLSDLGMYGTDVDRAAWLALGRRLSKSGHSLHALVPAPRRRWRGSAPRVWNARVWDRWRTPVGESCPDGASLLKLLAPALRIEPGLLRQARCDLLSADVATEMDAWLSPHVGTRWKSWLQISPDTLAGWRREWAGLDGQVRKEVAALIARWHDSAPEEIGHVETAIIHTLKPGTIDDERVDAAREFVAELYQSSNEDHLGVVDWLRGVRASVPGEVWQERRIGRALTRAWLQHCSQHDTAPAPAGVTEGDRVPPGGGGEVRTWAVLQRGSDLEVVAFDETDGRKRLDASPLLVFRTAYEHVAVGVEGAAPRLRLGSAKGNPRVALPSPPARPQSLVVEVAEGRCRLVPAERPKWVSEMSRDRYGLLMDVAIAEVKQRMRWIPPGRFWMGSPEGEQGRYDDEGPRHEVIVSRGFWMADTPVTQELWQAVMGENPSRFKSPDRPVDRVSWEDAKRFIDKLNRQHPEFAFRLPREYEWEHACRGGTTTGTWAGELEIRGANDAPLLDDIAWYGGNSGISFELEVGADSSNWPEKQYPHDKAGTHPVKGKQANPNGLYDMLGNVWEWCEDWFQPYREGVERDPPLPPSGPTRVFRGGSWDGGARGVRSACRYGYDPSDRWINRGFRLVRGQEPAGKKAEPRDEAKREPGNGAEGRGGVPASRRAGPRRPGRAT